MNFGVGEIGVFVYWLIEWVKIRKFSVRECLTGVVIVSIRGSWIEWKDGGTRM